MFSSLKRVEVIGRRNCRSWKAIAELTREREDRMKMLLNSSCLCIFMYYITLPPELLRCVEAMLELDVTPGFETLRDHIIPSLNLSQPRLTLQMLQNTGLSASATATPLLAVLVKKNMMNHAVDFGGW